MGSTTTITPWVDAGWAGMPQLMGERAGRNGGKLMGLLNVEKKAFWEDPAAVRGTRCRKEASAPFFCVREVWLVIVSDWNDVLVARF